jgi:hypothetical protein
VLGHRSVHVGVQFVVVGEDEPLVDDRVVQAL